MVVEGIFEGVGCFQGDSPSGPPCPPVLDIQIWQHLINGAFLLLTRAFRICIEVDFSVRNKLLRCCRAGSRDLTWNGGSIIISISISGNLEKSR